MDEKQELSRIAHLLQDPRLVGLLFGTKFFWSDFQEGQGKTSSTLRSIGFCDEEMRSGAYQKRLHPHDRTFYGDLWNRVNDGWEDELYCEYRLSDPDGKWHWIETHAMVLERTEGGSMATILGVDREITSRKNAEKYLNQQYHEAQRKYEIAESLRQTGTLITSDLKLSDSLIPGIQQLGTIVDFDWFGVYSLESGEIRKLLVFPEKDDDVLPDPAKWLDRLGATRYPIIIDDLGDRFSYPSLLAVPLVHKDRVLGVVLLGCAEPGGFRSADLYPVIAFADILVVAIRNSQDFRRAVAAVETDGLTGLLTRRSFDRDASTLWIDYQELYPANAVAMVDIDDFKMINDTYGHPAGDEVIRTVAELFGLNLRKGDLFARYGGDEFIAVLPDTTAADAWQIMDRIRRACESRKDIFEVTGTVTVSIGIVGSYGDPELAQMVAEADKALYRAKEKGRNRVEIF